MFGSLLFVGCWSVRLADAVRTILAPEKNCCSWLDHSSFIKRTAEEFGAGDPEFLALVRRAMEEEKETVGKRFGMKAS